MDLDIFLSYSHKDAESVNSLRRSLENIGVKCWIDTRHIKEGENFTCKIHESFLKCKAVVVWYSKSYPRSTACCNELHTAYLAAQQRGNPWERIFIMNPENQEQHIKLPSGLSGQNRLSASNVIKYDNAANCIFRWLEKIQSQFGMIVPKVTPRWYGRAADQPQSVFGRVTDIWKIDDWLNGGSNYNIAAGFQVNSVQVTGLGGIGKSLLAMKYAFDFGYSYPDGIFWLHALGGDSQYISSEELEAARVNQISIFAKALGIVVDERTADGIAASLANHFEKQYQENKHQSGNSRQYRFLWIVDDFPNFQTGEAFNKWMAPGNHGLTLFTTRSNEYRELGSKILCLDKLDDESAYDLLTRNEDKPIQSEEETASAKKIANILLNNYPLALEIAAAELKYSKSTTQYTDYLRSLEVSSVDVLEDGVFFLNELPTGHERSIAATLLRSIRKLDHNGKILLSLSSILAPAPIPAEFAKTVFNLIPNNTSLNPESNFNLALHNANNLSLVFEEKYDVSTYSYSVHSLVSRFAPYEEDCKNLIPSIRQVAINSLIEIFNCSLETNEKVESNEIDLLVKHAFQLIRIHFQEDGDVGLMHTMQKLFTKRNDITGANLNTSLATIYQAKGMFAECIDLLKTVLDFLTKDNTIDKMAISTVKNNLGNSLNEREDFGAASIYLAEALDLRKSLLGENHPDTIRIINNLALSRIGLGGKENLELSVTMLEEALSKFDEYLKFHPNDKIPLLFQLAVAYRKQYRVDDGIECMEKARDLSKKTNSDIDHRWNVRIAQKRAQLAQDILIDRFIALFK